MFNKVHIEISNVCNLQCTFCPEVIREKKLMSLDLFERVIHQVAPLTEQVAFHLMGDPLLHPKLAEMIALCARYKAPIFFVTNGLLLNPKNRAILSQDIFRQINFSLHSFNDNFPGRDPSKYLESIFSFTEETLRDRPMTYLNFRLWNLADVNGSRTANLDFLQRIAQRFGAEIPAVHDVRVRKSFRLKGRLYLHFDTEFQWPDPARPLLGTRGTCYGLESHFGVLADGTVVPCCLDKEGNIPLGDANTTAIADILSSPRAKALMAGFKKRTLVEDLCQRCSYIKRFDKSGIQTSKVLRPQSAQGGTLTTLANANK